MTEWTVYIFSNTGRTLWETDFMARDERDAERKALKLVKPQLHRFDDVDDWVFEPKPQGRRASAPAALFSDIKVAFDRTAGEPGST
jgi:hypothetical protein